jgi:hypothetical protein
VVFLALAGAAGVAWSSSWAQTEVEEAAPVLVSDPGRSAGGFTRVGAPELTWTDVGANVPFRLEIAADREMTLPLFRAVGRGSTLRVPAVALPLGHRYFVRVARGDSAVGSWRWSRPGWFVSDPRFLGYAALSVHHRPFGKAGNRILVRDRRGRLHLVFAGWTGKRREILYGISTDDGRTWEVRRVPGAGVGERVNYPSLALDYRRDVLHLAWSEAERFPGFIVHCSFDVAGEEPVLRDAPRVISGAGDRACVCIAPALAVDAEGVVHAAWEAVDMTPRGEGGVPPGLPGKHGWLGDIAYANSREGWGGVTRLRSVGGNGVAPTMGIDAGGTIHVLWEGGLYRRSTDGGCTWDPPLDEPPRSLFPELSGGERRARYCAIAAVPHSERVFAVAAAEDVVRSAGGRTRWSGPLNVHTLWARELIGGELGPLERVRGVSGRQVSSAESRDDPDGVHFLSLPTTSLSSSGTLAVVWEETRVIGDRKRIESRFAVRGSDGRWGTSHLIGERPETATVSAFPAPEFAEGLDVVWTEAEHYDWRDILGNDVKGRLPFISYLHGLFFSSFALTGEDLHAPAAGAAGAGLGGAPLPSWEELEDRLGAREGARSGAAAGGERFSWVDNAPLGAGPLLRRPREGSSRWSVRARRLRPRPTRRRPVRRLSTRGRRCPLRSALESSCRSWPIHMSIVGGGTITTARNQF